MTEQAAIVWLLREMGHSILITDGEECGRRGSCWLMAENQDIADEINDRHQFLVQFDRRNGKDFKCYNVGTDKFRSYVKESTGYTEPDLESFTDIVTLCRKVCGVNLSVGFRNEHKEYESLVLADWQHKLDMCRKWLQEPNLPKFSPKEKPEI